MSSRKKEPLWVQDQNSANTDIQAPKIVPINKSVLQKGPVTSRHINSRELMESEYEPLKWIIPGLLPEGLTILFSRPKIGKSMVALAISIKMVSETGPDFGGAGGEVLYLSLDDKSERRLQTRMRTLLQGEPINDKIRFVFDAPSLDNNLIEVFFKEWMNNYPETKLIVIDVYGAIKPPRKSDDVYKNDFDALASLRTFAEENHISILLIHHTRKQITGGDWIDGANGSTAITGAVDTIWLLERDRGSNNIELKTTSRDTGDAAFVLDLEDLTAPWVAKSDPVKPQNTQDLIMEALLACPDIEMKPKEIASLIGANKNTVLSSLRRMFNNGLVVQTKYGAYLPARKK